MKSNTTKALRKASVAAAVCLLFVCGTAAESYLYDADGKSVIVPDAYTVSAVYDGAFPGVGKLSAPSDLFADAAGRLYVADTGNDRIVVFDRDFRPLRVVNTVIKDGRTQTLNGPKGVFCDREGRIYIADTGNARVIAVDESDRVVRELKRDGLPAVNENMEFRPEKVAADSDGNVFVIDRNIYQGIVKYGPDDAFSLFFAPNEAEVTAGVLFLQLWKNLFNDERSDALKKTLPMPYANLFIDQENFVYACAYGVPENREIKRLNAVGENILRPPAGDSGQRLFGDAEITYENNEPVKNRFVDVHADPAGLICAADAAGGKLFIHNRDCELIAVVRTGVRELAAAEKVGDDYLVLDSAGAGITVFSPTPYMRDILAALAYYNEGRYVESVALWEKVLERNARFRIGLRSIGRARLQTGEFDKALQALKEGDDPYYYSLAFKEYRREFVRRRFLWLAVGIALSLFLFAKGFKRIRRWLAEGGKAVEA